MKYNAIDSSLFLENRKKYVALLPEKAIAFFNSNDEMPRNGDANFLFRQQSDLFWLTGIDQEQTILVVAPNHP
ncbi:MAG: aminopeptidase P N-terminal domain-containing protein, partial [bacterium]